MMWMKKGGREGRGLCVFLFEEVGRKIRIRLLCLVVWWVGW